MTNQQIADKLRNSGFIVSLHANGVLASLCGKVNAVEVETLLDYKVPKEMISERLNSVFVEISK